MCLSSVRSTGSWVSFVRLLSIAMSMKARHRFVAHTAEVTLRLTAQEPGALYAEAARALGAMFVDEVGSTGVREDRTLTLASADPEALLVDLLNELIYLAETGRWAPVTGTPLSVTARELRLLMTGTGLCDTPARVKSATHHGLHIARRGDTCTADVTLDV